MLPEELPQQKLYVVRGLPPKPAGFDCRCALGRDLPTGIAPALPPRSARFIAMVEWAWSPIHNRLDAYYLSTNRRRSHWLLWAMPDPEDNNAKAIAYAFGPKRGVPAKTAAVHLLLCTWLAEDSQLNTTRYHWIDDTGLLSVGELKAIADVVWGEKATVAKRGVEQAG